MNKLTEQPAQPSRGQRTFQLPSAVTRRWPALLGAGLLTLALPISIVFASVRFEEFGASRFTNPGNCDVPYSGYPCAAVVGVSTDTGHADPGVSGQGFVGVQGDGTYGIEGHGDSIGVYGIADSTSGTGVNARGGLVGLLANASGTSGVGVEAHGKALGITAQSDNTALGATGGKIGVYGNSFSGTAVQAESTNGTAVKATGTNGTAVEASSTNGTAVRGTGNRTANSFGTGVQAVGDFAIVARGTSFGVEATGVDTAVSGYADKVGGEFSGKEAPIRMIKASTAGAPASGVHHAGELYVDSAGLLFYCTADSTPANPAGTWHKVHLD